MAATPGLTFREHLVADDLKAAYQVVVADLNQDGRPDLIGLGQVAHRAAHAVAAA